MGETSLEGADGLRWIHSEDRDKVSGAVVKCLMDGFAGPIMVRANEDFGLYYFELRYRRFKDYLLVEWRQLMENPLTDRESRVLKLVCDGATNDVIARRMGVKVRTVESYRHRIAEKLGLSGTALQVRWAIRFGLVDA